MNDLEGEELAIAVMMARGGVKCKDGRGGYLLHGSFEWIRPDDELGDCRRDYTSNRPDIYIDEAWELVKELHKERIYVNTSTNPDGSTSVSARGNGGPGDKIFAVWSEDDSAATAICHAYLLAMRTK